MRAGDASESNEVAHAASQHAKKTPVEIIRESPLFDEAWYRRNHVDLLGPEDDAAEHYLEYATAGLDPSIHFSSSEYLALNLDVLMAGMNPLVHYERVPNVGSRPTNHRLQL